MAFQHIGNLVDDPATKNELGTRARHEPIEAVSQENDRRDDVERRSRDACNDSATWSSP
jgi:hypothetical protein